MNKRRWLLALAAFLPGLCVLAQAPAEVLSYSGSYEMKSPTEARYEVHLQVLVKDANGIGAATFSEFTDEFKTLSSFSGSITSGGKVVKKLRKQDVITQLQTASLAEKTYLNVYEPAASFPFIVEYDYTLDYRKAIATFPTFFPVPDFDIPLRQADYTLSVPASIPVRYKASLEPVRRTEKGREIYTWQFRDILATPEESGMPDALEWAPYVYACPAHFEYAGTSGSQESWKEIGAWNYGILPGDTALPEAVRRDISALVSGLDSDVDKLRAIYGYLKEHTRYVSIQLGIGGYVPASPEQVAATGFGDCKALSFYMKQLLAQAGILSDYALVSTRRKDLLADYASLGQMDHALLRVPLQQDTLWVECTNPSLPLGYAHSDVAGHQALLVLPEGGELVRIPDYPGQTGRDEMVIQVDLSRDGSAALSVRETARLDMSEPYVDFRSLKPADIQRKLLSGLQCHPDHFVFNGLNDNFTRYEGVPGYVPEVQLSYAFDSQDLARISADRMFVKLSPYARSLSYQKTARRHDFVVKHGCVFTDSITLTLPEGYDVEFLPEEVSRSTKLADFSFRAEASGRTVTLDFVLTVRAGRISPGEYDAFRELVKAANKVYGSTLVLKSTL